MDRIISILLTLTIIFAMKTYANNSPNQNDTFAATNMLNNMIGSTASPTPPQSTDGPTSCQSGITQFNFMNMLLGEPVGPTAPETGCSVSV